MLRFMSLSVQSEVIPVPSQEGSEQDRMRAAEVVIAYLKNTQLTGRVRAYQVLHELAVRTKHQLERGLSADFSSMNLKAGVAPDAAKEPSAWLSPHWATLMEAEPNWQEGMANEARRLGVEVIPKLEKIPGVPAIYRLLASPLPTESEAVKVAPVPEGGVYYTLEAVAAPGAWLRKTLVDGIVPWTAPMRWGVLCVLMGCLISVTFLGWLLLQGAARMWRPVATADLAILSMFVVCTALVIGMFRFVGDLFEMKVVLAPSLLTPLSADNVTLEHRLPSGEGSGHLVFGKYTSTCPACQGRVELYGGGRAFPARIVGRCNRSGREHVFSFDHVLRVGRPLR